MGKCFRCKEETRDHSKLGIYLCDECYTDDIDFCINPYCTNQGIRVYLMCEKCPKIKNSKGHDTLFYKCESDTCKFV